MKDMSDCILGAGGNGYMLKFVLRVSGFYF